MQVRIAELEILPEWLDAYLEAAGAVGAESVAKEPGVVCIFPMQKKESPTSIRIVAAFPQVQGGDSAHDQVARTRADAPIGREWHETDFQKAKIVSERTNQ